MDGFVRLMESDLQEPCNIGNPNERNMLELAESVNRYTGNRAGVRHLPLPPDDPKRRRPDIGRARAELGWEPKVDFQEGLSRTVAWFREELA